MSKIFEKIIKYRYLLFLILFVLCLVFKIHGSSTGFYDNYIPKKIIHSQKEEIFGSSRGLRSDEWMVHTPYYLSQKYNDYKKYSKKMSISGQNMILGYNSPVKDITIMGKPFTWGYIFFDNEHGLSWYWCLKLFTLILVSFELVMIITKKNKIISVLGSFLISFSPPLQWWFVPHITDVFIWAMLITVIGYHFFTAKTKNCKILYTLIWPCSIIGYCLALFPSCQVPLGFISLSLLLIFLIRDKDKITFNKNEWYRLLFVSLLSFAVIGYFIISSIDDIKLFMNTVYPGNRISTGGGATFRDLFTDLTTIFLPYKDITYLNNCEASTFIHLSPIFILLYPIIHFKLKGKRDLLVGKTLLIIIIVELLFMIIGFNEILAKVTLFSYINRMGLIYGFTSVLFTIWSVYAIYKYDIKFKKSYMFVLLFAVAYLFTLNELKLDFLPIYAYTFEILYLSIIIIFIMKKKIKIASFLLIVLIAVASFRINPISRGLSGIYNHPSSKKIRQIVKKDDGYWLATNSPAYANYILALGGNVINATNMYPDYDKWIIIDKDKRFDEYYNRYANMEFELTKDKTNFELKQEDLLHVNFNYQDLKKWKIKYILTIKHIDEDLKDENIDNKIIFDDGHIIIYRLFA